MTNETEIEVKEITPENDNAPVVPEVDALVNEGGAEIPAVELGIEITDDQA